MDAINAERTLRSVIEAAYPKGHVMRAALESIIRASRVASISNSGFRPLTVYPLVKSLPIEAFSGSCRHAVGLIEERTGGRLTLDIVGHPSRPELRMQFTAPFTKGCIGQVLALPDTTLADCHADDIAKQRGFIRLAEAIDDAIGQYEIDTWAEGMPYRSSPSEWL